MNEEEFEIFKLNLSKYLDFIIGEDLNLLEYANKNKINIYSASGNMDKGWKGAAVEHLLNIQKNNKKESDYGFLEVKTVPVVKKNNELKVKESTCLSVINTNNLISSTFEDSDLYKKIQKTLFIFIDVNNVNSPKVIDYLFFSLDKNKELFEGFKRDYSNLVEHIYDNLSNGDELDNNFSGKLGEYIQPRPKTGKRREYVWAFYMKTKTWEKIFDKKEDSCKPKLN